MWRGMRTAGPANRTAKTAHPERPGRSAVAILDL
jgi:hypothetical protein